MTTTPTLPAVTDRRFTARDVALKGGRALPEMTLAVRSGSWGGRRPSLGGEVTGRGPTGGATAGGGC